MLRLTPVLKIRSYVIRSRWKKWVVPIICTLPYLFSLVWLFSKGQVWIVQIMLAPLVMTLLIALLSFALAKLEFRR